MISRLLSPLFALVISFSALPTVLADTPEINVGYFNKLALNGYDPVAYFVEGKAMEGDRSITHEYRGATWVFANEKHRDLFIADPEPYIPQYGGYCAYAAAQGQASDVDPIAWRIYKGKLYLNYDMRVKRNWESHLDDYIKQGDANWPALLKD